MKHGRSIVAALLGTALLIGSLSGCGSTEPSGGSDGEYQKINLSIVCRNTNLSSLHRSKWNHIRMCFFHLF